jgi:phage gp29-like protein
MANEQPQKPELRELTGLVGEADIGALYAGELRLPDDKVLANRGGGDLLLYEEVLEDPQAYCTFEQRLDAVVAGEYYVEPGAKDKASTMAADFLAEQLAELSFDRSSRKMAYGNWYGFAVGECMFETDGRYVAMPEIRVRNRRRFKFDRNRNLRLIRHDDPMGVVLPPSKFWVYTSPCDHDDDPYGRALGRSNYWSVWFKRNGARLWPIYLDKFANPTPIGKYPPGSGEEFAKRVLSLLNNVRTGGALALPNSVQFDFAQALRSAGSDFQLFLEYWDKAISKTNLRQTMTTDDGSSRSQSETHNGVRLEVAKSDADLQCDSFNVGPARWLSAWNFPAATPPKVWRRVEASADTNLLAERDTKIYAIGFEPDEAYIQQMYGPGWTQRKGSPAPPSPPSTDDEPEEFTEAGAEVIGPAADAIERELGGDGWRRLMTPQLESLEQLATDCDSLSQFQERLGELAQQNPDAVTDSLARMMFAARVAGEGVAEVEETESES